MALSDEDIDDLSRRLSAIQYVITSLTMNLAVLHSKATGAPPDALPRAIALDAEKQVPNSPILDNRQAVLLLRERNKEVRAMMEKVVQLLPKEG